MPGLLKLFSWHLLMCVHVCFCLFATLYIMFLVRKFVIKFLGDYYWNFHLFEANCMSKKECFKKDEHVWTLLWGRCFCCWDWTAFVLCIYFCFDELYWFSRSNTVPGEFLALVSQMVKSWRDFGLFLRRFGKMTKEMRPNHRVDVLSDALLFYIKKRSASLG